MEEVLRHLVWDLLHDDASKLGRIVLEVFEPDELEDLSLFVFLELLRE